MERFDYIIAGGGCAGLSLLMHMIKSGSFFGKKILLIDKEQKPATSKTWCFWEKQAGLFEEIVFRKWDRVYFHHPLFSQKLSIHPLHYKMIRSSDFYSYCFNEIKKHSNVSIVYDNIISMDSTADGATVKTQSGEYNARFVFSSVPLNEPKQKGKYYLLQHFKGWLITSPQKVFDKDAATFMDFRIEQKNDTRFVYMLPHDEHTAMVEYTVFSENTLRDDEYDDELKNYISQHLGLTDYEITATESGIIPMTNHHFAQAKGNIIYIGTQGGQTKPSTGFTFQFIQNHSRAIVDALENNLPLNKAAYQPGRFLFYDSVLLNILSNHTFRGSDIFKKIFGKNNPATVLKFLENKTSLIEEIGLFSKLPLGVFSKAAFQELLARGK